MRHSDEGRYFTAKVPYGYNYYDLNDEILDPGPNASEHGMHVAGISAVNGNPEEGGVQGVHLKPSTCNEGI